MLQYARKLDKILSKQHIIASATVPRQGNKSRYTVMLVTTET